MKKNVYSLYYDKNKIEIKVQLLKGFVAQYDFVKKNMTSDDSIVYWNSCYYLSTNRKALLKKAREIKKGWITELEQKINTINSIVIK